MWDWVREYESAGNMQAMKFACEALLRDFPEDVAAWLRLSMAAQQAGRYRAALDSVVQAAKATVTSNDWSRLAQVSLRLLTFNRLDTSRELIEAADWDTPDVLRQAPSLSQHLWLGGYYDAAIRLIDAAERRVVPNHLLAYSRAIALRYLGRMDEATAAFERCIELAPDYAPAHWSLAYHAPGSTSAGRIRRIEKALEKHAAGTAAQIDLLYALYREWEQQGDMDCAWRALQCGAKTKRASIRYDSNRAIAASSHLRERLSLLGPVPVEADRPDCIFIVGLPRTGTTLLERILGNHSDVASAGELNDFHAALCWEADSFLTGADDPALTQGLEAVDFAAVGAFYRRSVARHRAGRRVLLDKNPANFSNVGLIARALPNARMLCLVRDPMDACFSNLKELFAGDAYPYSYDQHELADHYAAFDRARTHWERVLPGRFMSVRYEDLVNDAGGTTAHVLAFCRLEHEPGCERIERNSAPAATASSSQVREPIHRRFIGSWRAYARQLEPLRRRLQAHGFEVQP